MKIQTKNESYVSSSQSTETVIKTLEEPGPKQEKEDRQRIIIPELLVDGHFPKQAALFHFSFIHISCLIFSYAQKTGFLAKIDPPQLTLTSLILPPAGTRPPQQ